ncbi:MAG: class I SAM-dependent methyltransferase [Aggregatilineales bacterium]
MTLTPETLAFLASDTGARLLADLATADLSDNNTLALLTRLRRRCTPEQASAALEQARLRLKAVEKFDADAARMFFTRVALEQASDPLARRYRAQVAAGLDVVDAGCGVGADTLALAQAGGRALGLDIDPLRVLLARHNAAALGVEARFDVADVRAGLPPADLAFFDPARRSSAGSRIHDVERYDPPLATVRGWRAPRVVAKLSPGVDKAQLALYGGQVEFISAGGALKEAVLWLGFDAPRPAATLLLAEGAHHWHTPLRPAETRLSAPRGWLLEPDPALLRAGLVAEVASVWDAYQLDADIAYLTADTPPTTPWARAWRVLDWMPFNLKRLRAYLRERNVGTVTVKKRGAAISPEELIARLRLSGAETRTLALTRCAGQPAVLVCADA